MIKKYSFYFSSLVTIFSFSCMAMEHRETFPLDNASELPEWTASIFSSLLAQETKPGIRGGWSSGTGPQDLNCKRLPLGSVDFLP